MFRWTKVVIFFCAIFGAAYFSPKPLQRPIISFTPTISPRMSGITIQTAKHGAQKYDPYNRIQYASTVDQFFQHHPSYHRSIERILGSSYEPDNNGTIMFMNNGFVNTVVESYSRHINLVVRPDDVWIAILTQLSFHINANSEELRKSFVSHEGKKELTLKIPPSTLETIDWNEASDGMIDLMHENLVDKDLKDWIMPSFSTTTRTDSTVSAIVMMASMKAYFEYVFEMMCGIPQVTLQGTKEDWISILHRLEKLDSWDDTTRAWHKMLKPILKKFVMAFEGEVDLDFWGHIVSERHYGSGSTNIGGWITAFCAFSDNGKFYAGKDESLDDRWGKLEVYKLDGVPYPILKSSEIAAGNAEVNVTIIDFYKEHHDAALIAGNMGMKIMSEGPADMVQNVPVWACYLRDMAKEKNFENQMEKFRIIGYPWT